MPMAISASGSAADGGAWGSSPNGVICGSSPNLGVDGAVPNGIAYDKKAGRLFVTGKMWKLPLL